MKKFLILIFVLGMSPAYALSQYFTNIAGLRTNATVYDYAVVQGYWAPGDGGGGVFAHGPSLCTDNGGTIIEHGTGISSICWYRLSSNYGPKEFGAVANGSDTASALNSWLDANQPHVGDVATYSVASPLACAITRPTSIQGPSNADGAPLFHIQALSPFTGDAVVDASDYCRLSGVAIDANNATTSMMTPINGVQILGTHVVIDSHSLIENGFENVVCPGVPHVDGLQIKDSQIIDSADDGVQIKAGCSNARLIGDFISGSGNAPLAAGTNAVGVFFGGDEFTLANSSIVQSGGIGLNLETARQISITSNNFDDNGSRITTAASPAIRINGSSHVSICGNHVFRTTGTSHVLFVQSSDDLEFCGDVYAPGSSGTEATFRPSYVYDALFSPVLTNTHLYEQPGPQAAGNVYSQPSSLGQQIVAPLQVPQFTNQITGFTLSNSHTIPSRTIQIAAGTAADSTASALIQNPACSVNLGTNGAGGLDVNTVASSTTYFYYEIASAGGSNGGTPSASCIASLSSLLPAFSDPSLTAYQTTVSGQAVNGKPYLYLVPSVAGVKAGDAVISSSFGATSTVSAVGTYTENHAGTIGTSTCSGECFLTFMSGTTANLVAGMTVSDNKNSSTCPTGQGYIPANDTILSVVSSSTLMISVGASSGGTDCFTFSGANTITLSSNYTGTTGPTSAVIATGLYRLVGSLNTDGSGYMVQFIQNGDTFYLNKPGADLTGVTISTTPANYTLASLPNGIVVQAFGRCIGSSMVVGSRYALLSSPTTAPGTPTGFTAVPGASMEWPNQITTVPFRLYTNTSKQIQVAASTATGALLSCMTDGWVLKRAQ